jgi:hypothetical protein
MKRDSQPTSGGTRKACDSPDWPDDEETLLIPDDDPRLAAIATSPDFERFPPLCEHFMGTAVFTIMRLRDEHLRGPRA